MQSSKPVADNGFVRFPRAWLNLEVSPQAKLLLVTMCGVAKSDGQSYYSFNQLGQIIDRSKASISKYVDELTEVGVIATTRLTYGNGYNYRLLVTLRDWPKIISTWAAKRDTKSRSTTQKPAARAGDRKSGQACTQESSTVQPVERRVQHAERKDPTGPKNKNHQNKTPRAGNVNWTNEDEASWRRFRPNEKDPVTVTHGDLPPGLAAKLEAHEAALTREWGILKDRDAVQRCRAELLAFIRRRRLDASEGDIAKAADALARRARTVGEIQAGMSALEKTWQPHWRKLSTPRQIEKAIAGAVDAASPTEMRKEISKAKQRNFIVTLHRRRTGATVTRQVDQAAAA